MQWCKIWRNGLTEVEHRLLRAFAFQGTEIAEEVSSIIISSGGTIPSFKRKMGGHPTENNAVCFISSKNFSL